MLILNSIHKKLLFLFAVVIFIFVSVWAFVNYQATQKELPLAPISTSTPQSSIAPPPTSTILPNITQETKTYRNEEWGFEFQYPEDLVIRENTFVSYYSKFNLEIVTKIGEKFDPVFLINIVLPEFAERSFRNLEKTTSEIIIAGTQGIKYEFKYKGFSHTVIILPFRELRMILATGEGSKQYLDEFNQILAPFKFLK